MTDFSQFYALFPRKKSRGDAEKAWKQMLAAGHTADEIMAGLHRNLNDLKRKDPQFVPYPATWLRAQGWADEPDMVVPQRNTGRRTIRDAAADFDALYSDRNASFGVRQLQQH